MGTLGATLLNARLARQISVSQAAAATRIKVQMIERLENDDFSSIAAPIYGKGFIKIYAEYLKLDPAPLIEEYMSKTGNQPVPSLKSDPSGTLEHPVATKEDEAGGGSVDSSPAKFDWQRLNPFRRAVAAGEPGEANSEASVPLAKMLYVGFGVLIVLVFVVSALSRCSHRRAEPAFSQRGTPADLARELPPPYLEAGQ